MNWFKRAQMERREIAAGLSRLGLPATGTTTKMARLYDIAFRPPSTWTREEFEIVLPYIYIHQDYKDKEDKNVDSIMEEGLRHGMVDRLSGIAGSGGSHAGRLVGGHAYLFWPAHLKWRGNSGHLGPGTTPFHHFVSHEAQDVYEAVAKS